MAKVTRSAARPLRWTDHGSRVRGKKLLAASNGPHHWTAVQGLAKGERADVAVEALTELGADEIIAWQAERSVSRWDGKVARGIAKWSATARESTKQSRRFTVPRIRFASTDIIEVLHDHDMILVAHQDAVKTLAGLELPKSGRIAVVVGLEGGISLVEIERFIDAGAHIIRLGNGVLRTSSAGMVALAQLKLLAAQQIGEPSS
ncbi:RsmE family RNA methyltransferase [Propionibacterium sp. oral taxon 192 str. F0372]|uniref:16S rRNA (uracil(1498)-N(3))-methyltransferase n=1 Tax=Propionibacterium sp. oral taxon 192 TaxID=671222 RepID=UPI0003544F2D|nr:RsmE family RNA methyltransferase [Propionibacterium sp. oral taxon 192]EPH02954.1 RsmE family RNA methyltransferase [Propionibacterium sp. oral taxon 192 str. F0372]